MSCTRDLVRIIKHSSTSFNNTVIFSTSAVVRNSIKATKDLLMFNRWLQAMNLILIM